MFDKRRSPFLYGLHHPSTAGEAQVAVHLAQLFKALHGFLSCQGHGPLVQALVGTEHGPLVQALVGTCLRTTPGLVPHFIRGFPPLGAGPARGGPLPPQARRPSAVDLVAALVPSCITPTVLSKAVQSYQAAAR